ncbi:MAG: glycosyltransferase [Candidatus Kerfeldbacteria bacterium]|nr:glycosyltransferase [Candidatus Kerfeldbacteria bacterium]
MRIVAIGPTYPYRGGIAHFSTVLVEHLRKRHEVWFLTWKRLYPPFLYPSEQFDTVSKHHISTDAEYVLDYMKPWTWYRAFRRIREVNADLLLIHWWHPVMTPVYRFITFFVHRWTTAKIVFICHNVNPHEGFPGSRWLTTVALKSGHGFIVHNQRPLRTLRRLRPDANIQLAFHPIYSIFADVQEPSAPIEEKLLLRRKRLLFFGLVRPYKGIEYLLRAMPAILERHDVDLLIVGQFWKGKRPIMRLIQDLGIQEHVFIIDNYIRNEHVKKYFDATDLVVVPYVSGTQSGIIQTAYAFDRPVIATTVGGFPDAVRDGETGYLVPPADSAALARAVIDFYDHRRKDAFVENVRQYKARFSWDQYVRTIETLATNVREHV